LDYRTIKESNEQSELYIHIQKMINPNLPIEALLQELETFFPPTFDDSRCPLIFQHCDSCCLSELFSRVYPFAHYAYLYQFYSVHS